VVAHPPPVRKRRPVGVISAGITSVIYVIVIGLVLVWQPDPGRSSAAELAEGVQTALQQRQPDVFESLFARGALPDGYAEDLFAQVPAAAQVEARPIVVGEREGVTASATSGSERWCASWLVVPEDDRLVLSVTPALASC
jgi:hypothetical protein